MSFMMKKWALAAIALWAVGVQARTIEMVADVAVQSYEAGRVADGAAVYDSVAGFAPQHFDLTVRFDMDNPETDNDLLALSPLLRQALSWFNGGAGPSLSATPFSAGMMASVPPSPDKDPLVLGSSVVVSLSTPAVQPPTQPLRIAGDFSSSFGTYIGENGHGTFYGYDRVISFVHQGDVVSSDSVQPWSGDAYLSYLQSWVGQPGFGQYKEYVYQTTPSNDQVPYLEPLRAMGDVTIRSVAVVPEPASVALWGLGAVGLAVAVRGRRRSV